MCYFSVLIFCLPVEAVTWAVAAAVAGGDVPVNL